MSLNIDYIVLIATTLAALLSWVLAKYWANCPDSLSTTQTLAIVTVSILNPLVANFVISKLWTRSRPNCQHLVRTLTLVIALSECAGLTVWYAHLFGVI
jgi:hypothetical protein